MALLSKIPWGGVGFSLQGGLGGEVGGWGRTPRAATPPVCAGPTTRDRVYDWRKYLGSAAFGGERHATPWTR